MKSLLLMRHAKARRPEEAPTDHERKLNGRGRRDATAMGQLLAERQLEPDLILCSTSMRTTETADLVLACLGRPCALLSRADLYLAEPETILAAVRSADAELAQPTRPVDRLLVVGHNPGIEELIAALGRRAEDVPTATVALFSFDVPRWSDVGYESPCALGGIWRPSDLP